MNFDRKKYDAVLTELQLKKIQACFEVFIRDNQPSKNPTPLQKMIDEVRSSIPHGHRLLAAAHKVQLQNAHLLEAKLSDMTGQQLVDLSEIFVLHAIDLLIKLSESKQ
jgi:hypothetical protein